MKDRNGNRATEGDDKHTFIHVDLSLTHTHTHTLSLLSHSLTLTPTHTHTHSLSSHTHIFTHTHTHTPADTHANIHTRKHTHTPHTYTTHLAQTKDVAVTRATNEDAGAIFFHRTIHCRFDSYGFTLRNHRTQKRVLIHQVPLSSVKYVYVCMCMCVCVCVCDGNVY
jgi:hypothetical protein